MAILYDAELTPTKAEIIAGWLPTQPWAPKDVDGVDLVGAYRLDDPEGLVGLEVHLVQSGGHLLQVPLTYRGAPLDAGDAVLVSTMEHSVLGERWVYAGLSDPVFVRMAAAAAMTGCGQAIGMVDVDGRWSVMPTTVRLAGGGWPGGPTHIEQFTPQTDDGGWAVLRNDRFELRWAHRPVPCEQPPIGLTATWPGQDQPVALAELRLLETS